MALGILFILFVVMGLLGIISTVLLFLTKNKKTSDILMILMTAYSLIIAFLAATALPTNFVSKQIICWVISFIAVAGAGIHFGTKKQSVLSKLLVVVSVAGGLVNLFLL